jgi:formyl-CoA transferase
LNLKTEEGKEHFLRLLRGRDVLFENFRPGTLERWGFGTDDLREANPPGS